MIIVEQLAAGALREISLTAASGETVVILGPPGAGKTTLLRALAGFEPVRLGRVVVDGEPITALPPGQRPTAFVAHENSTFGHLTVFDNVAFGLRLRGEPDAVVRERAEDLIARVGLAAVADRPASALTDEGRWRVALARAVAIEPKVLLVDEPVGDPAVGLALARGLATRSEASLIAATCDRTAALSNSDRVAFLRAGRIEQIDTPVELFYRPATPFVADYVARANLLDCMIDGIGAGVVLVRVFDRRIAVPADRRAAASYHCGDRAILVARPEALRLVHDGDGVPAVIKQTAFLGATVAYEVEVEGQSLSIVAPDSRGRLYPPGTETRVGMIQEALSLLPYPSPV
ncbi:MAG: ABC transporter ATP-binding protein [Chloroflexota bacterium]|nr:ABC transporter ATP-binding protein [Dehalococcoidia bacterium]MDW8253079.1 ABC transporter ATP-binding protein [Chloroflexota bacterium]